MMQSLLMRTTEGRAGFFRAGAGADSGALPNGGPTGYLHGLYARSFQEFGTPRLLPLSGGWIIERTTPVLDYRDAMGCYPVFSCHDWDLLESDLGTLRNELVCLSLVTDPLGGCTPELLEPVFDSVVPYKQHFVADLDLPLERFTSARHRKYARRALRKISVEVCSDPLAHLDEWMQLYNCLIKKHQIRGLRCFSREAFAKQLSVPGLVMFRAAEGSEPLSLDLWYVQGDVAHAHLVGTSPRGYELQVSYGLKLFILEYFSGKVRYANLGAVPNVNPSEDSGLMFFKRGWSSETRTAWFCWKVFNRAVYERLVCATGTRETKYFPAYRQGEFS
jgi:hypothetical protein